MNRPTESPREPIGQPSAPFSKKELLPSLTDARLRFQTQVAANVPAVAGRELTTGEEHLAEEWSLMDAVLGKETMPLRTTELAQAIARRNDDLCQRLRAGEFDDAERTRELSEMRARRRPGSWRWRIHAGICGETLRSTFGPAPPRLASRHLADSLRSEDQGSEKMGRVFAPYQLWEVFRTDAPGIRRRG